MFGALSLITFLGESMTGQPEGGQTLTFMVLALSQVVQASNTRSEHPLFQIGVFTNHKPNWTALASTTLVALVMFTPLSTLFGLIPLSGKLYLILVFHKTDKYRFMRPLSSGQQHRRRKT